MGTWQKVMIGLWVLYIISGIVLDGREKRDIHGNVMKYSAGEILAQVLLEFIILYFGGFFK